MSSKSHYRAYQEFLTLLSKFQNNCDSFNAASSGTRLQQEFNSSLQQWFQDNIIPLTETELEQAIAFRWQSIQTEIKREFRLLTTDMIFLASSRQITTKEARLKLIGDRLTRLITYCQTISTLLIDSTLP